MKNTLTKITSGFIFAVFTVTICAPSATAAPVNEIPAPGSSFISQNTVESTTTIANLAIPSLNFSAKVVLNDSSGPQIIDTTDNGQNLSNLLKSRGFDVSDFRTSGDTALDENYHLSNSENLSLYKSESSGSSSVVVLPAPEEKRESADLFKGEEKVEKEGKNGEALRTVITKKNLATDTKVNASATKTKSEDSSEEKLTVLTAPESKVILVGTKERSAVASAPVSSTTDAPQAAGISQNIATKTSAGAATESRPTSPAPGKSANNSSNSGVVNRAMAEIGKPYVWGASGANAFDCSGLVKWVFGGNIPRTAYAQGLSGTPVNPADMQPGDLVYTSYHIGIYAGNGKMVHAATPATGVILDDVNLYLAQGYKVSRL